MCLERRHFEPGLRDPDDPRPVRGEGLARGVVGIGFEPALGLDDVQRPAARVVSSGQDVGGGMERGELPVDGDVDPIGGTDVVGVDLGVGRGSGDRSRQDVAAFPETGCTAVPVRVIALTEVPR